MVVVLPACQTSQMVTNSVSRDATGTVRYCTGYSLPGDVRAEKTPRS